MRFIECAAGYCERWMGMDEREFSHPRQSSKPVSIRVQANSGWVSNYNLPTSL